MNAEVPAAIPANFQDCFDYLLCDVTDQFIRCVLTFDTRLDAERLRRAARETIDMVPVLGCRYDTSVRRPMWRRIEGLEARPLVTLAETADPASAIELAVVAPMDRERDARVVLTLVRGPESDALVVTVDHVASDARGVKEYACLLASAYSRLAEDPDWRPAPGPVLRPDDGRLARAAIPWRDRWRSSLGMPKTPPGFVAPGRWADHSGRRVETATIEPAAFRSIRSWGRDRDLTVNDMLLAAMARAAFAIFDHTPGVPVTFQCTADLRRFIPEGGDGIVCNLSAVGKLPITPNAVESFEATADQARVRMAEWKDIYLGLGVSLVGSRVYRLGGLPLLRGLMAPGFEAMRVKGEASPALTNFGVIDDSRMRFADAAPVEAWMSGPLAFGNSLLVVASTYRDRLTLSTGWCDSDIDRDLPRDLLAGTARELSAVV